jgi:hypothetical protein
MDDVRRKTCWVPRISRPRLYFRIFLNFFVTAAALLLLLTFFPYLGSLEHFYYAFWLTLILAGLQIWNSDLSSQSSAAQAGIMDHPRIGFIAIRSKIPGAIAIGKKGKVFLSAGTTEGEDPLIEYGPLTLPNLVREYSFPKAPDILIMSTYWQDTDEVAPFEELVSSHGGVGGEQTRPFILYPAEFDLGTDNIVGAKTVYRIFKKWAARAHAP